MRKKNHSSKPRRIAAAARRNTPATDEKQAVLAALKRAYENKQSEIERTFKARAAKVKSAVRHFKVKKADRGKIVFVGVKGGRITGNTSRRGYAVYVNTKGKKQVVRQIARSTGRLEKIAIPRKLVSLDVSKVRSKRAKTQFLTARANPIASRELRKHGKGISSKGTRYAGKFATDKFYADADSVTVLSKELCAAANKQRSKKDFLVTIGFHLTDKRGKKHWLELQRRFSRQDGQKAEIADVRQFFGREIYGFLANELQMRGLVLAGSAAHIQRLKENRGKKRGEWTKDGFLWQGHDSENCKIESLEYRIDQLTLGN